MLLSLEMSERYMTCKSIFVQWKGENINRRLAVSLANVHAQTIASFEESNRMYAIPAETAVQGEPFQKENLPGPGK